jgi:SAM-dependent methyltransferase
LTADGGSGFWFDHRAQAVGACLEALRIPVLWEVGAGTGAMAHRLTDFVAEVVTVEPLAEGARSSASLGLPAFCGTLEDLHLPTGSLAAVGVFDVLEHLDSPGSLLTEIDRVLQPGGHLFVTVPALPWLWGDEDDAASHKRRYTKSTLRAELSAAHFTALRTTYLFASLVPPAAVLRAAPYRLGRRSSKEAVLNRMKSQLDTDPRIDHLARAVLQTESKVARHLALPFGLSLMGVFRKRGSDDAGGPT